MKLFYDLIFSVFIFLGEANLNYYRIVIIKTFIFLNFLTAYVVKILTFYFDFLITNICQ